MVPKAELDLRKINFIVFNMLNHLYHIITTNLREVRILFESLYVNLRLISYFEGSHPNRSLNCSKKMNVKMVCGPKRTNAGTYPL